MGPKLLLLVGSSRKDLRGFHPGARRRAGHELDLLQHGLEPTDFKPMPTVGPGACELRIRAGGSFRVFYVARLEEGIYVLHAFQKRSRRTSRIDLAVGATRYREVARRRGGS